ncbi:MAG TPA: hypothetical protein VHI78_04565 [Bacteroidales bacterium]|nr:hypothetical protein [Bacteroidales bacterium]
MKKSLIFRLLIILPFVLAACNKSDDEVQLDFEITLPENWVKFIYAEEGRVMDAARVAENADDTLPESLVIFRTHFPSSTLTNYYGTLRPAILASEAYDSVLYESDTTINAINFKKLLSQEHIFYVDNFSRDTIVAGAVTERYFVYHNEYGYNLTFIAVDTTYEEAKINFDNIIGTFRFKE